MVEDGEHAERHVDERHEVAEDGRPDQEAGARHDFHHEHHRRDRRRQHPYGHYHRAHELDDAPRRPH